MKINARKLALRILDDIQNSGDFSHVVINRTLGQYPIEAADRRFISNLVFGILENRIYLDFHIRKFSAQRFSRIHPSVVNILRMGFYQLIFLTKVPESAAVDECVKLAKLIHPKEGSFVNGILRQFIRTGKKVDLPDRKKHPVTYLGIVYSFPEWLVEKWLSQYGFDFTEGLLRASNEVPRLSVRVNLTKTTVASLMEDFSKVGVVAEISEKVPYGIVISDLNHLSIQDLPGFSEGAFAIQDISSMMVGHLVESTSGQTVIDVCAAPGGKTTHFAERVGEKGRVIARDLSEDKLKIIEENVERLGLKNVLVEPFDATAYDDSLKDLADCVLVDAPCSGLGIIRRKPDIKYNKTPESLLALTDIQSSILEVSSRYVKDGGTLVYSTCTINTDENEAIVQSFLSQHAEFELCPGGMVTLFPHIDHTDGFFIAKMKKSQGAR